MANVDVVGRVVWKGGRRVTSRRFAAGKDLSVLPFDSL